MCMYIFIYIYKLPHTAEKGYGTCMAEKNKLTVLIDGKEYTIVSERPIEHIQAVALCADTKMREIRSLDSSKSHSTAMIAVLTTINLAEDYLNSQAELTKTENLFADIQEKLDTAEGKISELETLVKLQEDEISRLKQELIKARTILKTKGINDDE